MKDPKTPIFRLILVLAAGIAASSCGGGYGGDGGGGGGGAATLNISIDPDTIAVGESATITWSSNGNGCTASGDWAGNKAGDGSEDVSPAEAGTYTYRMTCRGGGYGDSEQGSVTLTVNEPAQVTAWVGEGCCAEGRPFEVTGLTNSTGEHRFLALGRHYVGKPGAAREIFATCNDCLAGARLAGAGPFDLRKAAPHARAVSLAELEGHYAAQVASGYMLTIGIDAAGRMSGIDTRGCRLTGQVAAPARTASVFAVTLEVSACGTGDGQYAGNAAPLPGVDGGLLLSASNRNAAIGWRLGR
jgi:hypothetical protein